MCYITKDDFESLVLLHPLAKSWDYRCALPCPAYVEQETESRALLMLHKPSHN